MLSLLSVVWTGIGAKGSVRLPEASGTGSHKAPANFVSQVKVRWRQPVHVTVTKHDELCLHLLVGTEKCGHLPGCSGGLSWLGVARERNGAGLVACSSTSCFFCLTHLHYLNRLGVNVLERH